MNSRQHSFVSMSTLVTVRVASADVSSIAWKKLITACEEIFRAVVNKYSRFDPNSELSQLNHHFQFVREKQAVFYPVSVEMFRLIEVLLELAEFSKGLFDPTIIDLLEMYGYIQSFNPLSVKRNGLPATQLRSYLESRPSWRQIRLAKKTSSVYLAPGQRLDLGAIGKGYALDLAVAELSKYAQNFLIEAGGDLIGKGIDPDTAKPWQISLKLRLNSDNELETGLRYIPYRLPEEGQAVAASGSWARKSGKFHHLINPRTGLPGKNTAQTFVFGESAMLADGLATVLFLQGKKFLEKIAERYDYSGLLTTTKAEIWQSEDWRSNLPA